MIYDQTYNASFLRKLESIQYSACLAIDPEIIKTLNNNLRNVSNWVYQWK